MELKLLHQQQHVVEDDLGGFLLVALDVGQELGHGDIELLLANEREYYERLARKDPYGEKVPIIDKKEVVNIFTYRP